MKPIIIDKLGIKKWKHTVDNDELEKFDQDPSNL